MKLRDGRITMLFDRDGLELQLHDKDAGVQFATVKLDPEQMAEAFGRGWNTHCTIELMGMEKVGKVRASRELEAMMGDPEHFTYRNRDAEAVEAIRRVCPAGWTPDNYFNAQDSYFARDGKLWCRCMIRRWVEPEDSLEG